MKRIIFAICVLLTLSFVGCGEQQQSKTLDLSEKDKATVKAVVAAVRLVYLRNFMTSELPFGMSLTCPKRVYAKSGTARVSIVRS